MLPGPCHLPCSFSSGSQNGSMQCTLQGIHGSHEIGLSYIDHTFGAISRLSFSVCLEASLTQIMKYINSAFSCRVGFVWYELSQLFNGEPLLSSSITVVCCDSNCSLLGQTPTTSYFIWRQVPLGELHLYQGARTVGTLSGGRPDMQQQPTLTVCLFRNPTCIWLYCSYCPHFGGRL